MTDQPKIEYSFIELEEQLAKRETEVIGWRECALYDACMDGPKFRGWDRSALDRMRRKAEADPLAPLSEKEPADHDDLQAAECIRYQQARELDK